MELLKYMFWSDGLIMIVISWVGYKFGHSKVVDCVFIGAGVCGV